MQVGTVTVAQGPVGTTNWVVNAAQGAVGTTAWLIAGPVTVTGTANVVLSTAAATIGAVTIATGGAVIGVLGTGAATRGAVQLVTGAAVIGVLGTGAATLGAVLLVTGGNVIGILGTATATIGQVFLATAAATIGQVVLATGGNVIGILGTAAATIGQVFLATAAATIGQVVLATGAAVVGSVTQGTSPWTVQGNSPAVITGTLSSAAAVITVTNTTGLPHALLTVHGSYTGLTFQVEGSDDAGTTWYGLCAYNNKSELISTVANGIVPGSNATLSYSIDTQGFQLLRVRATAWSSGTASIGVTMIDQAPVKFSTVSQGDSGSTIQAWPMKVTDGTNTVAVDGSVAGLAISIDGINNVTPLVATAGMIKVAVLGNTGVALDSTAGVLDTNVAKVGAITVTGVAKGTQAVNAFPVQDFKDSGRTNVTLFYVSLAGITSEALATMQINKAGTITSGTAYTVTTAKTFRIQSVTIGGGITGATECKSRVTVHSATTVTVASPTVAILETGTQVAGTPLANTAFMPVSVSIPDGMEIAGGIQVGVSHLETVTTCIAMFSLIAFEY